MANFEQELQKLLGQFTPQGGFGIQNLGAFQNQLRTDSQRGLRATLGRDQFNLNRMGLGRSVGGAFSGGTRQRQSSEDLIRALMDLQQRHSELGFSQKNQLMQLLAPIAEQRANRPSWLSSLLGGVLGIGAQVAIPGIGGKIFGNPLEDALMKMFGQQQGGYGGYGGANMGNFNFGYTPRP